MRNSEEAGKLGRISVCAFCKNRNVVVETGGLGSVVVHRCRGQVMRPLGSRELCLGRRERRPDAAGRRTVPVITS